MWLSFRSFTSHRRFSLLLNKFYETFSIVAIEFSTYSPPRILLWYKRKFSLTLTMVDVCGTKNNSSPPNLLLLLSLLVVLLQPPSEPLAYPTQPSPSPSPSPCHSLHLLWTENLNRNLFYAVPILTSRIMYFVRIDKKIEKDNVAKIGILRVCVF